MKYLTSILFAGLITLFFSIPSSEAGCHSVSSYAYTPQYVAPQAVVSNAFLVQNQGYYNNQNIVLQPFAIPVAIVPQTFYSVLPDLAHARVNQELVDSAADKAAKKVFVDTVAALRGAPQENPRKDGVEDPTKLIKEDEKNLSNINTFKTMLVNKCIKCHGKGAEFNFTDYTKLDELTRLKIVFRIMTDDPKLKMPRDGNVSAKELDAAHAVVLLASKDSPRIENLEEKKNSPAPALIPKAANKE